MAKLDPLGNFLRTPLDLDNLEFAILYDLLAIFGASQILLHH